MGIWKRQEEALICEIENINEEKLKEEAEQQLQQLEGELRGVGARIEEVGKEKREEIRRLHLMYDNKLSNLEKRSQKLAAENFEYIMEQEELSKGLTASRETCKKLEKDIAQMKVEKQWFISNQKAVNEKQNNSVNIKSELEDL